MIGERLKYYRNQRGMTQEEVAEKMAVDTGVIDCWEKNILAPTPKELVSIVKILGVTAGKILDKNIVSEKDEDVFPKEQYYFGHVIGDEEKIRKEDASRFVKRVGIVYLALILIFCVIALITEELGVLFLCILGLFVLSIRTLIARHFYKKELNKQLNFTMLHTFFYEVYEDCVIVRMLELNRVLNGTKVMFNDLREMSTWDEYLFFKGAKESYCIRTADLSEDSVFWSLLDEFKGKHSKKKKK